MRILLVCLLLLLSAAQSAFADCAREIIYPDYTVTHRYRDGYTWARVWFGGEAETVIGTAGRQIGGNTALTYYEAPDGQLVLVQDYPETAYEAPALPRDCGGPVDDTDDAFVIDSGLFDEAAGQRADVYIFADYVLGERTEIPGALDSAGNLRLVMQVDQWMPGQRYAVLLEGVYAGSFALGDSFGLIVWEAA